MQLSIIKEILILIIDKTYFDYSSNMCSQKQPTNSQDCWLNYYSLPCFEYLPVNGSVIKLNFELF